MSNVEEFIIMRQTLVIKVAGKVQGVFFRQSCREKAEALGITGTVQNQSDGSVLITATGKEPVLSELIEWCKIGPPAAQVEECAVFHAPIRDFERFEILR